MSTTMFKGPLNKSRTKAELQAIANALEIQTDGTNPVILTRIQDHFKAHPELTADPRFQSLFVYRSAVSKGPGKGGVKKTSADKASEDAMQPKNKDIIATGANKTLLDKKITADPPALFMPLGRLSTPKGHDDDSGLDPLTPDTTSSGEYLAATAESDADLLQTPLEKMSLPRTPSKVSSVIVNFHDHNNPNAATQEVWVPPGKLVQMRPKADGDVEYVARLSQLLPEAITSNTPIKDRGGRIFRQGKSSEASRINLGTIDALLSDTQSGALAFENVNEISLKPSTTDTGVFSCDVYLDDQAKDKVDSGPVRAASAGPSNVLTQTGQDDKFVCYLRNLLKGPDKDWPRANTAGDILKRYLAAKEALEHLTELGWNKSTGGYQVPKDSKSFPGRIFIKDEVLKALRLGHTQASGDAKIFTNLKYAEKVRAWVRDPAGKHAEVFGIMKISEFKKYVEGKRERGKGKSTKGTGVEGKGRKRARSEDESDSVKLKKGKGRQIVDSDGLDDTSDSE